MRKQRNRRGSQAVEFALVLPVLVALTAGIVDYGWYYSQQLAVISAAREGARTGSATLKSSGTSACTASTSATSTALTNSSISLGTGSNTATLAKGTGSLSSTWLLTETVRIPYKALWGLMPTPANLGATVTVRMEDQSYTSGC